MNSNIITKVYLWMFIGLAVTFLTGSLIASNPDSVLTIFKGANVFILALIEIGLVIFLSARITKMSATTAKVLFILYSFVTGLTFSSIFIVYSISSIISVFLITALIMLVFSCLGYFLKIDLSKIGIFLLMALIGIIIASIVNIFIGSDQITFVVTIISVVVFVAYIAYDIQKIKYLQDYMPEENLAIYGALQLYLDFINIFIDLLQLFGDNR